MKIYEIMHLAKQTLNLLHASCIKMDDVRYLPLYDEYLKLKADGAKTHHRQLRGNPHWRSPLLLSH